MQILRFLVASLVISIGANGAVLAQFVGPTNQSLATVAEVLKNGKADQHVVLRGNLLRQVGSEKYEFSDGTGNIRVEIDRKLFPRSPIDEKTKVEIRGEVEKEFMSTPEIDVDSIRPIE